MPVKGNLPENGNQERRKEMKKLIFRTLDYYKIPWYMFELDNIYHIETIEYDGFDDPVLDGTVEYRVYI